MFKRDGNRFTFHVSRFSPEKPFHVFRFTFHVRKNPDWPQMDADHNAKSAFSALISGYGFVSGLLAQQFPHDLQQTVLIVTAYEAILAARVQGIIEMLFQID